MTTLGGRRFLAVLILAVGNTIGLAASAEDLKITDLMPSYWAFQDEVPQLQKADRILRRFREQIIDPHRDIYSRPGLRDAITDAAILEYLRQVAPDLPLMRTLSVNLEARTRGVVDRLKQQVPRFDPRLTIVFMPTLHRIDGEYTRILEQPTLLIGLDAVARFRGPDVDFDVLIAHELFHAHHARLNAALYRDENVPLYVRIWNEGLAAYVSERANPQASSLQVIGDGLAPMDRSPALVGPLAEMIRGNLDSINPAEQDKFLTYTAATQGVPGRSGYLVGYEIAKALAAKYPLGELTALRGGKLRELMQKQLEQMAADFLAKQGTSAPAGAAAMQSSASESL